MAGQIKVGSMLAYEPGNIAHQGAESRVDGTTFSRLHWFGVSNTNTASNFRHAWYDGTSYINVTASAGTVSFSGSISANASGTSAVPSFTADTSGGSYASMWSRRGAPFKTYVAHSGSSYAPSWACEYNNNAGWNGVYSGGVLNENAASAGSFVIHHINSSAAQSYSWTFQGSTGNFTASGNVTAYSDSRLKTDLEVITNAVDKVKQLTGYTYTRIDSGARQTGIIAQDLEKVLPEAVIEGNEYKSVAYGNMMGLIIEALKEIDARLAKLEGK